MGACVDVRKILRSKKRITKSGQWESGTMPRTAFPLSKSGNKAYRLGNRRWRVVNFDACEFNCRLLINYNAQLSQYQAILGVEARGDMKVLAFLEFHPTHKPWHAHVCCDDISSVSPGIKRGPWQKNMNGNGQRHKMGCPNTDLTAYNRAVSFFRLDLSDDGGLV